ncbi:DNA adenine methylase [Bathymodiolus thermophilus thioautotrophic gill symbiont]|uniref:site-specific DNA-methyltransferase (adenine-specific) n=1 Tax=Bathymodiolus thermophilus thioautotrophic gill symbiont TaxID=2360 RepID=A0A1J5TUE6_9GAMM|nr:DNA adenine methylase [Bathymodiolus thermophilus thioautotrophic gill symbiont]AYQ56053.1 DNA methyltransferase [Bathymodiolus thermophilus thioautotrophic gill symbiont]OIR24440.1 DNA methyltransferase [Bathymodiolus thermophilus thioautotrophic gill symbiont]
MFYSPLRYPGGKNKLSKFIAKICVDNNINSHYVEPYAGGSAVALHLLIEQKVEKITINDFDRSIYAFWHSVLKNTKKLCYLIENTEINIENWQKAKKTQKNKSKAKLLELGFATFFLNRTNISGIINAGVIGGIEQKGKYKINCRFNKKDLIRRIKLIAKYKKQIDLYNLDALKLIKKIQKESNNNKTIFYFDPPYYLKGSSLYMNHYKDDQHKEVSEAIKEIRNINWIISYDNTPEIEKIYKWVSKKLTKKYSFNHSAYRAREGKEILFFSDNLLVPNTLNINT